MNKRDLLGKQKSFNKELDALAAKIAKEEIDRELKINVDSLGRAIYAAHTLQLESFKSCPGANRGKPELDEKLAQPTSPAKYCSQSSRIKSYSISEKKPSGTLLAINFSASNIRNIDLTLPMRTKEVQPSRKLDFQIPEIIHGEENQAWEYLTNFL